MLDVVSLAELQKTAVPHTEDRFKYQYLLHQDRYGTESRSELTPQARCSHH